MKKLIPLAAALAAFFHTAPAQASPLDYDIGYAAGVMYVATCQVMEGEATYEVAARVAVTMLTNKGIDPKYSQRSDVQRLANAQYRAHRCTDL
jgi:hypothetical protein